jgi:hypothetical protein
MVYPRANLDTVPSLVAGVEQLAEAGYDVDVFTYLRSGQPAPTFDTSRVRIRPLGTEGLIDRTTAGLRSRVKQVGWLPSLARAPLARTYQALGAGLASGSRMAARARSAIQERDETYLCVIGVDPDGLVLAESLAHGAPLAYYSLELLLSYEIGTSSEQQLKAREQDLSRRAALVIVQDEDRARLLADDNALAPDRLVLVPNAPPGQARRKPSRYWHDRFGLVSDARVVIHSGSLGDWTGIESIVDSAADWPQPWVLVVHTRYDAESSSYVDGLRARADRERVFFSLKPVPRREYDPLIDGADVGLAFYVPQAGSAFTQRNVQTIGLSSGKLAYYLRAGLPVVVNRSSSIADVVDSTRIGMSVNSAAEIPQALLGVAAEYQQLSENAVTFFAERLDVQKAFGEVVRRLDALR